MDDKITIIEGPTPEFHRVEEDWARGISEGPTRHDFLLTNLRTYNSAALIERCYRTWRVRGMMLLEYRDSMGMTTQTPILAARALEAPEGQVLQLWVQMEPSQEIEQFLDDEGDDESDDENE
jgi:hypothetical protein